MMYFVYVLYSKAFDRQYVGMSQNVEKRLKEHNSRKTTSTKGFIPWSLIYTEEHNTLKEARTREKYLKSAAGRRWRKEHLTWPSSSTG